MFLRLDHHLKRSGSTGSPRPARWRGCQRFVGCRISATHDRFIDHVIEQQRRRMDEFDDRGQVVALGTPVTQAPQVNSSKADAAACHRPQ